MPRRVDPLTDAKIRQTKPGAQPVRLSDGGGLYLLVQPTGAKWWRFDYTFGGRRNVLSLGVYPDVTLAKARRKRADARALVADGSDPSVQRREARAQQVHTFKAVTREWLARQRPGWTPHTYAQALRTLATHVEPWLGARPVADIEPPDLLAVLRRIEDRGHIETAHRAKQRCGQIFRYAVATGRALRDPTADLRGALTPVTTTHRAALTDPADIGALVRAIRGFHGTFPVACALKLAPLVFVRPGELRRAEWTEVDLAAAEWRIPAAKMKMRDAHIVPLSRQAVAVLTDLQPLTGPAGYVFPSVRDPRRPMSENTINAALRRLGYAQDEMCGHGFRTVASTRLHELGFPSDVIERQLAHAERNAVKAAYNRAQHLPERRALMQAWADHLDTLAAGLRKVERRGR